MAAPFDVDYGLRSAAATQLPPPHTIPVVPEDDPMLLNVPAAPPGPPPVIEEPMPILANAAAAPGVLQFQGQALLDELLNFGSPYAPEPDVEPPVDYDDDEILTDESEESADGSEEEDDRSAPLGAPPVVQEHMADAAAARGQEVASSASQLQSLPPLGNCPESKRRRTEEQARLRLITEPGFCATQNASAAGPSTTTEESACVFNAIDPPTQEDLQEDPVPPPPEIEDLFTEEMIPENAPKQFFSSFSPASTPTYGSESPETGIQPSLDPLDRKGKAVAESPKEASSGAGPSGSSTEEQPVREGSPVPASDAEPEEISEG